MIDRSLIEVSYGLLFGQSLCLSHGDSPSFGFVLYQVHFVGKHHEMHFGGTLLSNFFHPHGNRFKAFLILNIIDKNYTVCVPQVHANYILVALVAGCVPDLHFNGGSVPKSVDRGCEFNSDCGGWVLRSPSQEILVDDVRLADSDLEQLYPCSPTRPIFTPCFSCICSNKKLLIVMHEQQQDQLAQEEAQIKEYLKTVPYEVLLQQRKQAQNQQRKLKKHTKEQPTQKQSEKPEEEPIKKGRYTPIERSAKQRVSRFKVVFESKRKKGFDPRFQQYAGKLDTDRAQKSYSFIENMQENQKNVLKKSLSSKKITAQQKEVLLKRYNQVTDAIKSNSNRNIEMDVIRENKKQVSEGLKSGNNVFYKTKKIIKAEVQQRKLAQLPEKKLNKLIKEKKQNLDRRMKFRQRQYTRAADRATQPQTNP